MDRDKIISIIRDAFASVEYPGDWCLRRSDLGDEPFLVEEEFCGKSDWSTLTPEFLDQAPQGLGSALSFFSDAAFRFFLPAYLIADIEGKLNRVDPVFYLCNGLDDVSSQKKVNPKLYGQRTKYDESSHRFSVFNENEASAIVSYLLLMREEDPLDQTIIDQSLKNYWESRTKSS